MLGKKLKHEKCFHLFLLTQSAFLLCPWGEPRKTLSLWELYLPGLGEQLKGWSSWLNPVGSGAGPAGEAVPWPTEQGCVLARVALLDWRPRQLCAQLGCWLSHNTLAHAHQLSTGTTFFANVYGLWINETVKFC